VLNADLAVLEVTSESGRDLRPRLAAAVVAQNWDLLDLHAINLSLEEIFLRVTTTEEEADAQPDDAEYFESGEEDDPTVSEQEDYYEDLGDAGDDTDEVVEEPPPPVAPAPRPPTRGDNTGRKGGRR
jgi:hypothetical protein